MPYDELAGAYLMRNRWHSPTLGRFISRDPAGYVDGMSLYAYVSGNPLKYWDPFGLAECSADFFQDQRIKRLLRGEITKEQFREEELAAAAGALLGVPGPEDLLLAGAFRLMARGLARLSRVGRGARAGAKAGKLGDEVADETNDVVRQTERGDAGTQRTRTATEQQRNAKGQFVARNAGEVQPGSLAERVIWDAIAANKPGWQLTRGRVYTTNPSRQVRVYDGFVTSPSGHNIGLEVKSGTGHRRAAQRMFDAWLNSDRLNRAVGTGRYQNLEIRRAVELRTQ
jgi:RHS repeat-associated protein